MTKGDYRTRHNNIDMTIYQSLVVTSEDRVINFGALAQKYDLLQAECLASGRSIYEMPRCMTRMPCQIIPY